MDSYKAISRIISIIILLLVQESTSTDVNTNMRPAMQAIQLLGRISEGEQLQIMVDWFSNFASCNYGVHINPDFLQLSLNASHYLKQCKRENVVYGVAKAVGRMCPDDSDSRLPAKRMPMGLLEHIILNFFNADSYSQVGMHCHGANKVAGSVCAKRMNPGVSEELLRKIHSWRREGASDKDVIIRLRQRTVPDGYSYHTWIPGLY